MLWLQGFATVEDVRRAVDAWWPICNLRRPHQALKYQTPHEVRVAKLEPVARAA